MYSQIISIDTGRIGLGDSRWDILYTTDGTYGYGDGIEYGIRPTALSSRVSHRRPPPSPPDSISTSLSSHPQTVYNTKTPRHFFGKFVYQISTCTRHVHGTQCTNARVQCVVSCHTRFFL